VPLARFEAPAVFEAQTARIYRLTPAIPITAVNRSVIVPLNIGLTENLRDIRNSPTKKWAI
jgi:hypothetical protein